MSLVITTYVPEGIVMASDSRRSITIEGKAPDGKDLPKIDTVSSDNAYKTYLPLAKRSKPGSSQTFFKRPCSFVYGHSPKVCGQQSSGNHQKEY